MLNGVLRLHDIADTEAYVQRIITAGKLSLSHHDREDLAAYLVETAWELSTTNPPPWRTSFSGWVHPILRLRIIDWQRRRNGRTTWKFSGHTYQRTRPTLEPYDPLAHADRPATWDPATDRDPDLLRVLSRRGSSEAWRIETRRRPMPRRAT